MLILGCLAFALAGRHAAIGQGFLGDTRAALWTGRARYEQGLSSALVVLLLSASFYCAGRAAGVELSLPRTLFVAPLVLGAMAIPLAIAGWGLREAAAAALFASLGMKAADGVAVSVEEVTSYVSLRQKRQPSLTTAAAHGRAFDAGFRFARIDAG